MHSNAIPITHGSGTLLAAEYGLLTIVRGLLDEENGSHAEGLARILEHHGEQPGATLTLPEQRDRLLPHCDFDEVDRLVSQRIAAGRR
ncbi:hypothetical protein OPIT5_29585 [Opitutaceae bacterium TAV5]|nr:hypothetical protein OPIT5_29585 [Opitutaceae bacterium TAV5]